MNFNSTYGKIGHPPGVRRKAAQTDIRIIYDMVQPKHRQGVLQVLTQAFVNEPSTAAQTIGRPSYDHWHRFIELYMDECNTNHLSVVALDGRDGQTVVGAFINRDFLTPTDPRVIDLMQATSPLAPIAQALEIIDDAWFQKHPEIPRNESGRVAELWMVGVHPVFRGHHIAATLSKRALEQVAGAGFEYAVVECTGAFSQHAMEAAGCTAVYALDYGDFLWNGEAIFKDVPAPHSKWVIYEKRLNPRR